MFWAYIRWIFFGNPSVLVFTDMPGKRVLLRGARVIAGVPLVNLAGIEYLLNEDGTILGIEGWTWKEAIGVVR
jgi:hypothetical protein